MAVFYKVLIFCASLLGVWKYVGNATDIDNLTTPGYYVAWNDSFGYYVVEVFKAGNGGLFQKYTSLQEIKVRYRTPSGSWGNWKGTELS